MIYNGSSYHIEFRNSHFDSALELSWFLFLSELEITKNNLSSHPLDYKYGLSWYPDLKFILFNPIHTDIFAEVKPLSKIKFNSELTLSKYIHGNNMVCLLGESNLDYQLTKHNLELTKVLDENFQTNSALWKSCNLKAIEFAQKFGSTKRTAFIEKDPRITFGRYKGYSLKEIKEKDPKYYKWYMDQND